MDSTVVSNVSLATNQLLVAVQALMLVITAILAIFKKGGTK